MSARPHSLRGLQKGIRFPPFPASQRPLAFLGLSPFPLPPKYMSPISAPFIISLFSLTLIFLSLSIRILVITWVYLGIQDNLPILRSLIYLITSAKASPPLPSPPPCKITYLQILGSRYELFGGGGSGIIQPTPKPKTTYIAMTYRKQ